MAGRFVGRPKSLGRFGIRPAVRAFDRAAPLRVWLAATLTSNHAIALTTGINFDRNESGSGMYPYSSKPIWPSPIVACINAFTAVPVGVSGYFEQTIS